MHNFVVLKSVRVVLQPQIAPKPDLGCPCNSLAPPRLRLYITGPCALFYFLGVNVIFFQLFIENRV